MPVPKNIKPSASGYYEVQLARSFPHQGWTFSPGASATRVDRATLDAMIAADVVTDVRAAD